jgi:hypothetical protein
MKVDVNRMHDYFQVLNFVSSQASVLGNAQPARHMSDNESLLGKTLNRSEVESAEVSPVMEGGVSIAFVAGSIRDNEQERMNRMIFRVTRGKALTYFQDY